MFLLRHGQSYFNLHFNATRVDPEIEDPELTPLGIEQAEAAAAELAEVALTRIIVSPYTRALQTAEPILAVHQVPVHVMQEVRERAAFVCDIGSPPHRLADRAQINWLVARDVLRGLVKKGHATALKNGRFGPAPQSTTLSRGDVLQP